MSVSRRCVSASWELYEKARRIIPLGTQTNSKAPCAELRDVEPCFVRRGEGGRIWDIDGNEYLDFRCSLGPITLGHNFPAVRHAVLDQMTRGTLFSYPCELEVEVAEQLCQIIPCGQMVRFLKTGGEAMAAACKVARAFTGKDVILRCGYHGWLSTTDQRGVPAEVGGLLPSFAYGDEAGLRHLVEEYIDRLAAISLAPSYAHMSPNDSFLAKAREIASQAGALLILDEIVTGFRVAVAGAQEYFRVTPDLAVFSKGMANGFPISALLGKEEVMRVLETTTVSSTFGGDALALSAAKATLGVYRNEPVIERLWSLGQRLMEGANALFMDAGLPIRYAGLPCCPQLLFEDNDPDRNRAWWLQLFGGLLSRGVLIYSVTYVNYSHTEADIDHTLEAWAATLRQDLGAPRLF